jgi:uncharacterized protein (TIGR02453 family)
VLAFGSVAWRMTMLCALCYAAATWLLCSSIVFITNCRWSGGLVALAFAFSPLAWTYATHTDVFALNVLLAAIAFRSLLAWSASRGLGPLACAAIAMGLSLGSHLTAIWLLPGLVAFLVGKRRAIDRRSCAVLLACFLAGVAVYAYLPIASAANFAAARDPTLALGVGAGRPFFDYAHPAELRNFIWLVTGAQVHAASDVVRSFDVPAHAAGVGAALALLARGYPLPLTALALGGLVWLALRADRTIAGSLALCILAGVPFLAAFAPETDPARYWLVPAWFLSVAAGVGLAELLRFIDHRFGTGVERSAYAILALALIANEQVTSRHLYLQPRNHLGRTYVDRVRALTTSRAIVIVPWVPATPLAYAAYVDGSMDRRIVETATLADDVSRLPQWLDRGDVYTIAYATPALRGVRLGPPQLLHLSSEPAHDAKLWKLLPAARNDGSARAPVEELPMAFDGIPAGGLTFLRGLARHNDRAWFTARKDAYERDLKEPLKDLVTELSARFARARIPIVGFPDAAIFRIHRDVRFSPDKRPYKTNVGAYLTRDGSRNSPGGVYIHIQPGESFVSAGFHGIEPPMLARWRRSLVDDPKAFRSVVRALAKGGLVVTPPEQREGSLKRPPRGFGDVDDDIAALLRLRGFTTWRGVSDREVCSPALADTAAEIAKAALPLLRYGWNVAQT